MPTTRRNSRTDLKVGPGHGTRPMRRIPPGRAHPRGVDSSGAERRPPGGKTVDRALSGSYREIIPCRPQRPAAEPRRKTELPRTCATFEHDSFRGELASLSCTTGVARSVGCGRPKMNRHSGELSPDFADRVLRLADRRLA